MTGVSAIWWVSTMSDSETVAPLPLPPSPEPEPAPAIPICFRMPTAVLTRPEMRRHVLAEMVLWLTGPVLSAARAAEDEGGPVEGGPVGQLILIMEALRIKDASVVPEDRGAALAYAATQTVETCQRFLLDEEVHPADEPEDLMMDFVDEITVDGKQTLQDLWDHSPFEALRTAPPLTDEEDEEEEDESPKTLLAVLRLPVEIRVPIGAILGAIVVMIAYLILAAIASQKRH